MSHLRQAQCALTALFSIGLAIHAARLVIGIDAMQALVMTRSFDSLFALFMLLVLIPLWQARNSIAFRGVANAHCFGGPSAMLH